MGEWTGLVAILIGFALIGIAVRVIFSYFAINVVIFIGGLIVIVCGFWYFFTQSYSGNSPHK